MNPPKILVVEDETDVRELMQLHLWRAGLESVALDDGEKALQALNTTSFDLAILDWMIPGISGLDLCKRFKGKMPILMVTARANASDVVSGLEAGADDYITKPFEVAVFIARVRALLRRGQLAKAGAAGELLEVGELRLDLAGRRLIRGNAEIALTPSEFNLLAELMKNRGRVLSRKQLIELVHGRGIIVVDRAIDTLVFGLRQKLGASADLVETVRNIGYRIKILEPEMHAIN